MSLTPNKSLINAEFDGYKLDSDSSTIEKITEKIVAKPLHAEIDHSKHFSLEYLKSVEFQNSLVADPWREDVCYFLDAESYLVEVSLEDGAVVQKRLIQLESAKTCEDNETFTPSLILLSPHYFLISNGSGSLFIVQSNENKENYQIKLSCQPFEGKPYIILSGNYQKQDDDSLKLSALCWRVNDDLDQLSTDLAYVTASQKDSASSVTLENNISLKGHHPPLYGKISADLKQFTVLSQSPFSETIEKRELKEGDEKDNTLYLHVYDVEQNCKLVTTHNTLSERWILNGAINNSCDSYFGIQDDVDCLVYEINDSLDEIKHTSTFNALSFVLESKEDRKFLCAGLERGYVAVCNCTRQVFIYYKSEQGSNSAVQKLLQLEQITEIFGMASTKNCLFFLTEDHVTCMRL